jgi:hypothetical protein
MSDDRADGLSVVVQPKRIPRPRRAHLKQQRRRAFTFSLFAVAAIGGLVVLNIFWTSAPPPKLSDVSSPELAAREAQIGRIEIHNGDGRCQQIKFDNERETTIDNPGPCPKPVLDARGVPVPQGTIHRLDAISKSFFGR